MDKLSRIYQVGYKHIPANKALSDEWAHKAEAARKREGNGSKPSFRPARPACLKAFQTTDKNGYQASFTGLIFNDITHSSISKKQQT